jgi:M6 family metalloprotease-like protein/uncharacterized repeat protein (TIGR02543 family)
MNAKRKALKRIMAIALASLMVLAALVSIVPLFVSAADEGELSYPVTDYNPGEKCYAPIPMLVVMINFDADGDGVDANPNGDGALIETEDGKYVKGKNRPEYGEQWCHTTEADWVSRLFSFEGNTLNSYYKYMSGGKFHWIPAQETYGEANNGVIAVTIDNVHPDCNGVSENWFHCFTDVIAAATEYVDFSIYDTNGNGMLDKYELCLAFILGGAETSSGQTSIKEPFGFHAYYKSYDAANRYDTDGVVVGGSGFFGTGAISGGKALSFGVFAHELGHYLGAPDLYDTDGSVYDMAVGTASLMASGAHGSTPAHLDPYLLSEFGFSAPYTVSEDGTYTVYSKSSEKGEYNIIKLCTPDPREYYLIENRFSSKKGGSGFDGTVDQGILIWHIDERIHTRTGMTCNSADHGFDPAVVVYSPIKEAGNTASVLTIYGSFKQGAQYENYSVFKPTAYTFPKSETWYTTMTEEQAKVMENLCVEVLSAPGDEMQIKITGSYKQILPPEFTMFFYDQTKTSATVKGELRTLNYSTMTSAKFIVSEKKTGNIVREEALKLRSDYTYEVALDGLTPGTTYVCNIVAESTHGQAVHESEFYTVPEEAKYANITLVVNSDNFKTTTQKVKVGSNHVVRIELNKYGYTFDGWYLDEAYTQPYTPGKIEEEGDFTIYAKWTVKATQAPPPTTTPPATTTDAAMPSEPVSGGCGGSASTTANPMLVGGAVIAILGAAAGGKKRKKSSDED